MYAVLSHETYSNLYVLREYTILLMQIFVWSIPSWGLNVMFFVELMSQNLTE